MMEASMTRKIKAAIKAKLIELEAYVDDELPDYIMVMVANKKTQEQMTSDLALFLGEDADRFAAWLHRVLNKLQKLSERNKAENAAKDGTATGADVSKASSIGRKEDAPPVSFSLKARKSESKEPSPAPTSQPKKIAISIKRKIEIKTKTRGNKDAATVDSPVASPRLDTPSPVSTLSPRAASPPPRTPTPETASDEDRKRKAPPVDDEDARKRKRDDDGEAEARKRERQLEVEEKERNIVLIMDQIKKLKHKLVERAAEESASDDDDDDEDDMSEVIREKITALRQRLESIQEELAEEEEEEEEDEDEEKREKRLETENILQSTDETGVEVPNDVDDGIKAANDSVAVVEHPAEQREENESLDSRSTTPVMDELPSPKADSNDVPSEAVIVVNASIDPPDECLDVDAQRLQRLHLPLFLLGAEDWRDCLECGGPEAATVCSGCRVVLHCGADKNCFRSWHLKGVDCEERLKLKSIPTSVR